MAPQLTPADEAGSTDESADRPVATARRTDEERADRLRDSSKRDPTEDRTHDCPLCGFGDESRDEVYEHLLVSHRKSAISLALLRARPSKVP